MNDKDALQKLTEAGEIQAAMERIADLEAALCDALESWDTTTHKKNHDGRLWQSMEELREALAGKLRSAAKEAQRLTDVEIDDMWFRRDCINAIQSGDILAQVRSVTRAAIAKATGNAL